MMEGWIKLHRNALESGMMQNPKLWTFWCWCLLKASHKDHKQFVGFDMEELRPGQFIFGRKKAATELGMSEQSIRTCVNTLKKRGNITSRATNKYTVITILNWGTYQTLNKESNQQSNQQPTNNQPTANHKQECKECKETVSGPRDGERVDRKKEETQKYLSLAGRLSSIVAKRRNIKIDARKLAGWANSIRLIVERDGISAEDIQNVLDWYTNHWSDDFVPVVESGKSLREKFGRIKDSMGRANKGVQFDQFGQAINTTHNGGVWQ